jgi:hypothetical protein
MLIRELQRGIRLDLPDRHYITRDDINMKWLKRILTTTYETSPADFEALLAVKGVGPKAVRSLVLIAELIYGAKPSFRDPARYSFAHGGKDGIPYPVDRTTYDRTTEIMRRAVESAKIGRREKLDAIRNLARFYAM